MPPLAPTPTPVLKLLELNQVTARCSTCQLLLVTCMGMLYSGGNMRQLPSFFGRQTPLHLPWGRNMHRGGYHKAANVLLGPCPTSPWSDWLLRPVPHATCHAQTIHTLVTHRTQVGHPCPHSSAPVCRRVKSSHSRGCCSHWGT